jgi:invasion protein IalB
MILRMAASALAVFAATTGALAQSVTPPDKYGLGRVQSVPAATPIVYSRWIRTCGSGAPQMCRTAKTARLAGVGAELIERDGDDKKVLRVMLPPGFRRSEGARMFIDDGTARNGNYVGCVAQGCIVDFDIDAAFIARLKTGQHLQIRGVNAFWQLTSYRLPLGDFAAAADRAPSDPAVYREQQRRGDELRPPPR